MTFLYIMTFLYYMVGLYMVISIIRTNEFLVKLTEIEKEVGKKVGTAETLLISLMLLLPVICWPVFFLIRKTK